MALKVAIIINNAGSMVRGGREGGCDDRPAGMSAEGRGGLQEAIPISCIPSVELAFTAPQLPA